MKTAPTIVAETLLQLAEWAAEDRAPEALVELAELVATENYTEALSCPMCQEIECDAGCPLSEMRTP